ncbi:CST complex subunit Ten1 [Amylocarpus encephaloides]|uniref:CST complex subunit Ten1 n=1 Tax=Amylocarpus encephaloides TaxID=45428 RepID=A0A9P7YS97_9HELO|nr:CST complex subunit Ten1 [Amylocarpus encephaloides]
MAGYLNGPLPSKLTLLSDLPMFSTGDKIRFLGCVEQYSSKSATLTLEHNYPQGQSVKAHVDVQLLLSSLKPHETQIGEWVNVIGYVTKNSEGGGSNKDDIQIHVQALILWSTGSFDLHGYERSLVSRILHSLGND